MLTSNDYSLEEGEVLIFSRELDGGFKEACAEVLRKRKLVVAGRDYALEDTCLACFSDPKARGGCGELASSTKGSASAKKLLGCKGCPMAFHVQCTRKFGCEPMQGMLGGLTFTCPQHACGLCSRKAAAAGGMLFRCEVCPATYCEDCLPREATIVGGSPRLEARGIRMPNQGCYIHCSPRCHSATLTSLPAAPPVLDFAPLDLVEIGSDMRSEAEAATEERSSTDSSFATPMDSEGGSHTTATAALASVGRNDGAQDAVAGRPDGGVGEKTFSKLFDEIVTARKHGEVSVAAAFDTDLRKVLLEGFEVAEGDGAFFIASAIKLVRRGIARGIAGSQTKALFEQAVQSGTLLCDTEIGGGGGGSTRPRPPSPRSCALPR